MRTTLTREAPISNGRIAAPSAPMFPTGLSAAAAATTQVNLAWNAVAGATSYNVKRSATSGGPYTTIATGVTATNYTDTMPAGMKYYYVVTAVSGGVESPNSLEATVNLPYPWLTQDIGSVGLTGSASLSSWRVHGDRGRCGHLGHDSDAFRFAYVAVTGNCTMIARVTSVQNIDRLVKSR